jgi:hypothetical protein
MGIEPPAGQGISGINVLGADPVPEQPVAGLHDGPVIAPLIDRPRDRDRPPEQHAGHPHHDHYLCGAQARHQKRREPRQERQIVSVIIEPQGLEEQALQEQVQEQDRVGLPAPVRPLSESIPEDGH